MTRDFFYGIDPGSERPAGELLTVTVMPSMHHVLRALFTRTDILTCCRVRSVSVGVEPLAWTREDDDEGGTTLRLDAPRHVAAGEQVSIELEMLADGRPVFTAIAEHAKDGS